MKRWKLALATYGCALAIAPNVASAQSDESTGDAATADAEKQTSVFGNYSVRLGIESAGPMLFRDVPDQRLEATSVFQYGGRLAFLFGNELTDVHRFGVGASYNFVGKSETRKLGFVDLYAMYETGHPLVLQASVGANIATGTTEFADEYGGLYSALALRYSFVTASRFSAVSVSPGLVAKSYLVTSDAQMSSFFFGAQLEFSYNTNK